MLRRPGAWGMTGMVENELSLTMFEHGQKSIVFLHAQIPIKKAW
jgi:hypothetical protein